MIILVYIVFAGALIHALTYDNRKQLKYIVLAPLAVVALAIGGLLMWLESLGNKGDKK